MTSKSDTVKVGHRQNWTRQSRTPSKTDTTRVGHRQSRTVAKSDIVKVRHRQSRTSPNPQLLGSIRVYKVSNTSNPDTFTSIICEEILLRQTRITIMSRFDAARVLVQLLVSVITLLKSCNCFFCTNIFKYKIPNKLFCKNI